MKELVSLNQHEKPVTTSLLIAEKFDKRHDRVIRKIREISLPKNEEPNTEIVKFSRRNFRLKKYKDSRGKNQPMYEVTRAGFAILAMGFTGDKAMLWKIKYEKAFSTMENYLHGIALERQTSEWIMARIEGKMQRRSFTDILAPYQTYAINQGSKGASRNAYVNFTKLVNKAAGVQANEREMLTDDMLRRIAYLEYTVESKVKVLMEQSIYCKDIYQQCKELLENFVEVVPYSGEVYLPKKEQSLLEATG